MKGSSEGWPSWVGVDYRMLESAFDAIHDIQRNRISQLELAESQLKFDISCRTHRPTTVMLRGISGCDATDPRDKVYALYNLDIWTYNQYGRQGVRPKIDYTVPWQIVYFRAARWMYETQQREVIATAGRTNHRRYSIIPSWVPDWRFSIPNAFVPRNQWSAGGQRPLSPRFMTLPSFKEQLPTHWYTNQRGRRKRIPGVGMELTAALLDRIGYKSLCLCTESDYFVNNVTQIRKIVQSDLDFCAENVPRYCTGETFEEAYAMTIIAETDHEDNIAEAEYATDGFRQWLNWLDNGFPDPGPLIHTAIESAALFTENLFGVTAHGLMCLMPQMSRVGDYVAVFENVTIPCVLRRVGPPEGNYFELLGQCYVHGMMAGRVWDLVGEFRCKHVLGSEDEVPKGVKRHTYVPDGGPDDSSCADPPFNAKGDYLNVRRVLGPRKVVLV